MNITDVCIKRPVLAWMLMAATILFGVLAATRIGISQMPDVDSPNISVSVSWAGASPEEVEHGIIEPLEQALAQVEGIQSINASARPGSARLTAVFALSRNIDLALQDVQAKVAQAQRQLPKDVLQPTISKSNPDDQPILTVGISGPFARQVLADVARYQVQQRLQTIPGVGQVSTNGYLERMIRLWVDADRLMETGTTVADITSALNRQHVVMPGGELETPGRSISVRMLGEAADLEALRKIIIREVNGAPIYLRDVCVVEDGFEDVRSLARSDGVPLQALSILKQRGANAVAVAGEVRAVLDELRASLPEGMQVEVLFDTTKFIEESVHEIEIELVIAVILTSLVCWLFLGSLSSTMNVLLAIPMSLLGTIAVIWAVGFTLNTFTLLGLSLAIGLVVDDAVMVMENIYRHGEMGKGSFQAASEGTKEITFAALAATAAVIAIFLPVVFMEGVVGRYFFQFGVTLSVAVAISYVEAITLAPARCARLLHGTGHARTGLGRLVDRAFEGLSAGYGRVLRRALGRPWLVLLAGLAVLGGSALAMSALPTEFVPSQDQSRIVVRLTAAAGADLHETDAFVKRAEAYLATRPEVVSTMATAYGNGGTLSITLVPPDERAMTQAELSAVLRKDLAYPGVRVVVQDLSQQGLTGQRGFPIEFSVRGPDFDELVEIAARVRRELTQSGVAADIDSDYQLGLPEVQITPDRDRAADLGVSIDDVATTVNALIGGVTVGKYSSGGRRLDVRLRLLREQRLRPEDIGKLRVRTGDGDMVPLSTLVTVEEKPVLQAINHADRERAISVFGNIAPGRSQGEALAFVQGLARDVPPGYRIVLGGQSVQFQDSTSSLIFALAMGIAVAYMVLAAQFDSFLHPVTVLSILPLSIAGAALGLLVFGKSLNVFSMIGVLLLMGITKKNSIILVDYANVMREEGHDAREAMQRAGPVRLRPILMTTVATMMAAVPAALGLGAGAETRGPMAVAILGGLFVSTVLSLVVVPAFYLVADRLKARAGRLRRGRSPEGPGAAAAS
ncbi:efflux RND transporter permease subunit [Sorangium sp. So ce291]|uniref:efflux RND transporter permease subunit n=1 Tax=Sorangium sp. So ce291 TaxID=3133294 RepID=UPI003F630897